MYYREPFPNKYLSRMFTQILSKITNPESRCLLEQSYNASVAALKLQVRDNRIAASMNGEVVSESESESESDSAVVSNIVSSEVKGLITKKRRKSSNKEVSFQQDTTEAHWDRVASKLRRFQIESLPNSVEKAY